jgi:hypothetical protein
MAELLVNRIMKESGGSIIAAEIYNQKNCNAHSIRYYINGVPSGSFHYENITNEEAEKFANSWINGIQNLKG